MTMSMLEAAEPPEVRGRSRDDVRLLAGHRGSGAVSHHRFDELPSLLGEGDVLVVNTSATLPAAVPVLDDDLTVNFSTAWHEGQWIIELRRGGAPYLDAVVGACYPLRGGGAIVLRRPYSPGRLWTADLHLGGLGVVEYLERNGAPIRYRYVPRPWGIGYYQ